MSLMYEVNTLNAAMVKAAEVCRQDMPEGDKVNAVLACFAGMKPVEAEPVVHAVWASDEEGNQVCTACAHRLPLYPCENPETEEEWDEEIDKTPFCPFCGACMDGVIDCRICTNCDLENERCLLYGADPDKAVERCAAYGFMGYVPQGVQHAAD